MEDELAVRDYMQLVVWQKAMDLVEQIYRTTRVFPKEEQYGLTAQIRRAAVSIPSNIAEGQGRHTTRDFLYFLAVAHGSLNELQTQVLISQRLVYVNPQEGTELTNLADEVGRLINGLVASLKNRHPKPNH